MARMPAYTPCPRTVLFTCATESTAEELAHAVRREGGRGLNARASTPDASAAAGKQGYVSPAWSSSTEAIRGMGAEGVLQCSGRKGRTLPSREAIVTSVHNAALAAAATAHAAAVDNSSRIMSGSITGARAAREDKGA